jgi:hypothetical protein
MPSLLVSLLIVLAMGLGVVLCVWGVFTVGPVVNRVVARSFWCRLRKRNVSAEFQEDPWSGRRFDITRCTAFEPSSAITCGRDCLRLPKLDPARDPETTAELEEEEEEEETLIEPRWVTADAERVAREKMSVELRR